MSAEPNGYRAAGFFLLRTAAIPPEDIMRVLAECGLPDDGWLKAYADGVLDLWRRPAVAAAVRTAAPDLADAVDRLDDCTVKKWRRTVMSLGRYLNRMSVRPTPLGLLAGV